MNNSDTKSPNPNGFSLINVLSLPVLLYILAFLGLMGVLFQPAYSIMWVWWQAEDYNHCMIVPLIVLYLFWEKRKQLLAIPAATDWSGIALLCLGIGFYWLGELGGEFYTIYMASWFVLVGFYWFMLGWRHLKAAIFPLTFLIAMFPFPRMINDSLTFKLKLISSQIGVKMIQLYGMSAYREGNIIDLGFTKLQVVEACSGLRFFLPLIVLGVLLAYYYRAAWWKRTTLVLLAVPITIFMNSFRIASVGVLYPIFGPQVAEGFFHDFSGWLVFMLSLGVMLCFLWLMKRFLPEPKLATPDSDSDVQVDTAQPLQSSSPFRWSFALLAPVLLLGASLVAASTIDFREKVPMRNPVSAFPDQIAEWQGKKQEMEKIYLDELGLSDYLLIDFRNQQGRLVSFYMAYNETQRKGKASHSPETCLPGNGWTFEKSGLVSVPLSSGGTIDVKRVIMEKSGEKNLVYFWFPQRGRVLHNLFEIKFYTFLDALTKQRTDGALVRLITPIGSRETPQEAELRLQGFVNTLLPVLGTYLPGKDL